MKIDELPVDILIRIFSYLSSYKNIYLVNRTFHDIMCKFTDGNISLILDQSLFQNDENFQRFLSVVRTIRKFEKVELNCTDLGGEHMQTVTSIINKFSSSIKYFKLENGELEMVDYFNILSLVSGATHLHLRYLKVPQTFKKTKRQPTRRKDLNFKHLKTLEFSECDDAYVDIFNWLPKGVLTELRLDVGDLRRFKGLFKRQINIKKLHLFGWPENTESEVIVDILDKLNLESLHFECMYLKGVSTALSKQKMLKTLTSTYLINADKHLMKVLANELTELETLDWYFYYTPVEDFVMIEKFQNLKHLTLDLDIPYILDAFIDLDNSRIITLELKNIDHEDSYDKIEKLATSLPNLKILRLCDSSLTWEWIGVILQHFNFVDGLHFGIDRHITQQNDEYYLNGSDSSNPKLTELSVLEAKCNRTFIRKTIADYPNLKKLKLKCSNGVTFQQLQLILNTFTKLELLKLNLEKSMTVHYLKCLRYHKTNLKFVLFEYLDSNLMPPHVDDLETLFGVTKVLGKRILAAVDMKTMQREMYDSDWDCTANY